MSAVISTYICFFWSGKLLAPCFSLTPFILPLAFPHALVFYSSVNVARFCIEAYDDVHAADDVASAVSNVDAREGGKLGWADRIESRRPCPEV